MYEKMLDFLILFAVLNFINEINKEFEGYKVRVESLILSKIHFSNKKRKLLYHTLVSNQKYLKNAHV